MSITLITFGLIIFISGLFFIKKKSRSSGNKTYPKDYKSEPQRKIEPRYKNTPIWNSQLPSEYICQNKKYLFDCFIKEAAGNDKITNIRNKDKFTFKKPER